MAFFLKFSMHEGCEEILLSPDNVVSVTAETSKTGAKRLRSKIVYRTGVSFLDGTNEVTVDHSIDEIANMLNEAGQ